VIVFVVISSKAIAQNGEIDASKPTNFYTAMNNAFEFYNERNVENIWSYRAKFMYSPSKSHLFIGELPVGYNDLTLKIGLRDLRGKYFFLPYKNYDKFVGAFGPSVDLIAPTGNYDDRLGLGYWLISPGVTMGLMVADWIQFFPVLSYQYISRPIYDVGPDSKSEPMHGFSFKTIIPIVFNEDFFMQITPIYQMNDFTNANEGRYLQEIFAAYSLQEHMQLTAYYNSNYEDNKSTIGLGFTFFF